MSEPREATAAEVHADEILIVRRGPGANCSSVGSVLDILFLSTVAGGAILAGIAAALARPEREPAPPTEPEPAPAPEAARDPDHDARPD